MQSLRERLTKCFKTVFPKLPNSEVPSASVATITEWDSIATLTLIAVIEEEFSVDVDVGSAEDLLSFDAIETYLGTICRAEDSQISNVQTGRMAGFRSYGAK